MVKAEDPDTLCSKHKAVSTLLPYAIWQERDGKPEMLDTLLHAIRATRMLNPMWHHTNQYTGRLFSGATTRAIVLAAPYTLWHTRREDLVQRWATAATVVPYAEEVAQGVVDMLLQIASDKRLAHHITIDIWWWLVTRPSLPPVSMGRCFGTNLDVVKTVRRLKDAEILTSYLLLLWSEWNPLWDDSSVGEMCTSIREDLGVIGVGHHRADLIRRLDHIEKLDFGPEYLKECNPVLKDDHIRGMSERYGKLKDTLLETNIRVISRTSYPMIILLCILSRVDAHSISHNIYVCISSPTLIAPHLERSAPSTSVPALVLLFSETQMCAVPASPGG